MKRFSQSFILLTLFTALLMSCTSAPKSQDPLQKPDKGQAGSVKNGQSGSASSQATNPTIGDNVDYSGPLPGKMLIADRGNSRLLIITPDKNIIWSMQLGTGGGPKNENSLGADDAFLTPDQKHIIINEEDNHVVAIIDIATKKIVWSYGQAGIPGSKEGYLHTPDDAYQLPDGTVTVADIKNQRILFINQQGKVFKQYGTTGYRKHNPPLSLSAPNGDTPLPDGGMLITEIGGSYADRLDKAGKLIYSVHFKDIAYPSDTQLLANGNLMTVDYSTPGKIEIVDTKGNIVWKYFKKSGEGMLAKPSLAIMLPNGNIAVNDDYQHRVVIINPKTNEIVWQYGQTGQPGTAENRLNVPDGIDFIPATWEVPKG